MVGFLGVWLACGIVASVSLQLAGTLDFQKLAVCLVGGPVLLIASLYQAGVKLSQDEENEDG